MSSKGIFVALGLLAVNRKTVRTFSETAKAVRQTDDHREPPISHIFNEAANSGRKQVLIFVHGGLVSFDDSTDRT